MMHADTCMAASRITNLARATFFRPGLHVYGLRDEDRLKDRVATFSFRLKDISTIRC